MPQAPLLDAWSKLTTACSALKERPSFRATLKSFLHIARLLGGVAWQILRMTFRSITSIMVLIASLILGSALGYYCFLGGSSAVGMCFKGVLATHLLDAKNAAAASQEVMKGAGISSVFSVGFLAWKRWPEFTAAIRAAWRWIWIGGVEETRGLVAALSKQLVVYAGLFFAVFVLDSMAKNGSNPPIDADKRVPSESPPYVTQLSQILDIKLGPIINVRESLEQVTKALTLIDARSGLVVYLDKSPPQLSDQTRFHLSYVVLFDNASFESDRRVGRTLSPAENIRLKNFANSLRQIAETLRDSGNEAGRLRIEVRGFASDAPKNWAAKEKDEKNNEVATDRAQTVYDFLCSVLKDTAVDLPLPVPWEKSGLEMHKRRQFNDGPIWRPSSADTADAEAPNRRVEILVTLPPELRVRGVSDDLAQEDGSRR